MAAIAREAGISKALLYHYFPSKQAYFGATLEEAAAEVAARVTPPPGGDPGEQLRTALDAWLRVDRREPPRLREAHALGHRPRRGARARRWRPRRHVGVDRRGRSGPRRPATVSARGGRAWLWFVDGACLDRIEHGDVERDELRELLAATLAGAVDAAGCADVAARLRAAS